MCPLLGGAGSPSNTMSPGPRPTSAPSGILIPFPRTHPSRPLQLRSSAPRVSPFPWTPQCCRRIGAYGSGHTMLKSPCWRDCTIFVSLAILFIHEMITRFTAFVLPVALCQHAQCGPVGYQETVRVYSIIGSGSGFTVNLTGSEFGVGFTLDSDSL